LKTFWDWDGTGKLIQNFPQYGTGAVQKSWDWADLGHILVPMNAL